MSHNITLSGVKIKDLDTFAKIVTEMSNGQATLHKKASRFRTYAGQDPACDAKIKMPGPHDVGLKKNKDGSYTPVFDPYNMSPIFKNDGCTNRIGKLLQEYALQEAEYEAARNGFTATRVPGEKNTVTLELVPVAA
jgi:hypothetical protein